MIKNNLQQILDNSRTSQRALARAIGTRPNTISDIAGNKLTRYDINIIERICDYFGIEIEEFFYKADEREREKEK